MSQAGRRPFLDSSPPGDHTQETKAPSRAERPSQCRDYDGLWRCRAFIGLIMTDYGYADYDTMTAECPHHDGELTRALNL